MEHLTSGMIDTLSLRSASINDEKELTALWQACDLTVSYNNTSDDFHFALNKAASDILVGTIHSQIVGSVMVGHDGHRGWIYYVAAHPDFQKQGIGRQMVKAAEAWLNERDVKKLMLLVRETNTSVVNFYKHLGFESAPRIVMQKWLHKD